MPLTTGTRLGPYEIVAPIGAGGMGEVYKARDTRLDRTVALKVIQSSIADSAEMRERFEREARAISALDHPNICMLYDVSREAGLSFLVMQYLEGETLADRLARALKPLSDPSRPSSGSGETTLATISRGPIPFDTVLKWGVEIAHALDAAHRRGIVHRDLKPGNVMVTKAGTKLLDFGLAKLAAGETSPLGDGATRTSPLTSQGAILGTLHYMSPEQLEGRDVDARSDIHAFGALLYEMLTGRRAFEGQSQAGIIASIINNDPPPIATLADGRITLPVVAQRALDRLLARCLAKNPDDRWQSAGDLAAELQWIGEERLRNVPDSAATVPGGGAPDQVSRSRERLWMAVAAAAAIALVGVTVWLYPRPAPPPAPVSFTIGPPEGYEFAPGPGLMSLSPDGRRLAFTTGAGSELRLWIRDLGSLAAQRVDRGDGAWHPAWSPDGRSVLYTGSGGASPLRRLDLAGGPATTLAAISPGRAAWGAGFVLFEFQNKLYRVPEAGGDATVAMDLDSKRQESNLRWPAFLPDGRRYVFSADTADSARAGLFLASLDSQGRTQLANVQSNVDYSGGYLFYQRDGTLLAHPFDANAGRTTGEAFPVIESLRYNAGNGRAAFSVSASGTLAYVVEDRSNVDARTIALFDRSGKRIRQLGGPGAYTQATFSPNGRQAIVVDEANLTTRRGTMHLLDLERGVFTRFTVGDVDERSPVWSHDGANLFFYSVRAGKTGIYRRNAGGGATTDDLVLQSDELLLPTGISPDGKQLLATRGLAATQRVAVISLEGTPKLVDAFPGSTVAQHQAQFSPDGKWIAYTESTGPATGDVYLQPFPADGRRVRVSPAGGRHPHWALDGRSIVYRTLKNAVATVTLKPDGSAFIPAAPAEHFTQPRPSAFNWTFSLDPRGAQLLLIEPPQKAAEIKPSPITVVVNFVQSLAGRSR